MKIRLTAPGGPLPVRASPERLFQVFENLLDNARASPPPAAQSPSPSNGETTPPPSASTTKVRASPETHLDRIFDRFFTYRPGEPDARNGHRGLGLAIAKAIVQGYGGVIRAENRAEGAAGFEVVLPAQGGVGNL